MINVKKLVVFDLETAGAYATLEDLAADNPRMAALWDKRCEFLRTRYPENSEMTNSELYIAKAGLHAEFLKIVCASFGIIKKSGEIVVKSVCSEDENQVLDFCTQMINNGDKLGLSLAGHNIERFDIPVLWKRYLSNRVKPPGLINTWNKKPWDLSHFDLAKFWAGGVWQESFASLDTICAILGVNTPKDGIRADGVHTAFWSGDVDGVKTYCDKDVHATVECIQILDNTVNS